MKKILVMSFITINSFAAMELWNSKSVNPFGNSKPEFKTVKNCAKNIPFLTCEKIGVVATPSDVNAVKKSLNSFISSQNKTNSNLNMKIVDAIESVYQDEQFMEDVISSVEEKIEIKYKAKIDELIKRIEMLESN